MMLYLVLDWHPTGRALGTRGVAARGCTYYADCRRNRGFVTRQKQATNVRDFERPHVSGV